MVRSVENSHDTRPRGGLRERKKLAVRRALGSAAFRLAMERGLENVTIEDITAEAGVSLPCASLRKVSGAVRGSGRLGPCSR